MTQQPNQKHLSTPSINPRKLPKQQRSIAMVKALKESCLQILKNEGAEQLNLAHLSDISGVAVASIYEYFPTIESVVAAVLKEYRYQRAIMIKKQLNALDNNSTLKDAIAIWVNESIAMRISLSQLHKEIYDRHINEFEVPLRELINSDRKELAIQTEGMCSLMQRFASEITFDNMHEAVFITLRLIQTASSCITLEHTFLDPCISERIVESIYQLLTYQPNQLRSE